MRNQKMRPPSPHKLGKQITQERHQFRGAEKLVLSQALGATYVPPEGTLAEPGPRAKLRGRLLQERVVMRCAII